ncbi:MAG: Uma2 family endonuclease [Acidobacteriota bacterium]|nr:Uma2 family endonuclease [Acidobacteriota bacterium]
MATVLDQPTQAQQKVILHGVTWETYERLLAEHQDSSSTRFAYDRGTLEIMILSLRHERLKHTLATLVEIVAEEMQIDIEGTGSTTFRREDLERGFEPDACFYIINAERIRQKDEIDLTTDPPPEIIIEIDISSPSLSKFPIFAALGVAEVWRYDGARIGIFCLAAGGYVTATESTTLPGVTDTILNRLLEASRTMKRTDWTRLVRESVSKAAGEGE